MNIALAGQFEARKGEGGELSHSRLGSKVLKYLSNGIINNSVNFLKWRLNVESYSTPVPRKKK